MRSLQVSSQAVVEAPSAGQVERVTPYLLISYNVIHAIGRPLIPFESSRFAVARLFVVGALSSTAHYSKSVHDVLPHSIEQSQDSSAWLIRSAAAIGD